MTILTALKIECSQNIVIVQRHCSKKRKHVFSMVFTLSNAFRTKKANIRLCYAMDPINDLKKSVVVSF